MAKDRHVAIYMRVSSSSQKTASQEADLKRWVNAFADSSPVVHYLDKFTGTTMERPGWSRLEAEIKRGNVSKVVIWRLDRLGRTVSGLTKLFEELRALRVGLVSVMDSLDLDTPAGRLLANVLASVACYETEVRGERQLAGIAAAKEAGKTWGGRKTGDAWKATPEIKRQAHRMIADGESKLATARMLGISRPTLYSILAEAASASAAARVAE